MPSKRRTDGSTAQRSAGAEQLENDGTGRSEVMKMTVTNLTDMSEDEEYYFGQQFLTTLWLNQKNVDGVHIEFEVM